MKIHPKQVVPAIKHIGHHWSKGCKCILCQSVDKREQIVVSYKEK